MADFLTNVGIGVKTLFDTSNTFHTAMTGGLWFVESKPKNTFPYCVYKITSNKPIYYFGASNPEEGEDISVSFTIFDKSSSAININTYESYLRALFDWASISVTGYTLMEMRRDNSVPPSRINNVWVTTVTYKLKIDEN